MLEMVTQGAQMSDDATPDVYRYTPADLRAAVAAERERCERLQIEIDRLRWALTDVLKVATSWSLFNTTTIDRKPSSTALRLRAAEAVLRGPDVT